MILHNTLCCCFEERAKGRNGQRDGWCVCFVLSSYTIVLSLTQPAITAPLIRFTERGQMQGSYLDYLNTAKWVSHQNPLWTGSWNNSDHSWQQRISGDCTHIWHGIQMSFHLWRALKGDGRHLSCHTDRLAVGEDSGDRYWHQYESQNEIEQIC